MLQPGGRVPEPVPLPVEESIITKVNKKKDEDE
jgi:hypothetical protein